MKIVITEKQLKNINKFILTEQANISTVVTSHKWYKSFMKKLSKTSTLIWDNTFKRYEKKGLTLDDNERIEILDLFTKKLNKAKNPKKQYRKIKHISIRGKNEAPEVVDIEEVEEVAPCPAITIEIDGIGGSDYTPFINNRGELGDGLQDDISEAIGDVKEVRETYGNDLVINASLSISTSASRIVNGGQAKGWSFLKLSQLRANTVKNAIVGPLQSLGVNIKTSDVNFNGDNGDGSSGPNSPNPKPIAVDEGAVQKVDTDTSEENRNKYGTPEASIADYEQFKYCKVTLVIGGELPGQEGEGGVESEEEVIVNQKWNVGFKLKKTWNPKWPNWNISFKKIFKRRRRNPRRRKITTKMMNKCPKF